MLDWIQNNVELIGLAWLVLVALAEFLKRVIPGTKDDKIIVRVMDLLGKIGTLGASSLLPNQDGKLK